MFSRSSIIVKTQVLERLDRGLNDSKLRTLYTCIYQVVAQKHYNKLDLVAGDVRTTAVQSTSSTFMSFHSCRIHIYGQ